MRSYFSPFPLSRFLQNADGTRPELYKLDLWNTSNPQPDFNERRNLAAAFPARVAVLKAAVEVRDGLARFPPFLLLRATQGTSARPFPQGARVFLLNMLNAERFLIRQSS